MVRLKTKLDQLVGIGCKGFAVLWDDIDTHLPLIDMKSFNTLADAHVKVCNEIYEHLKQPAFLTCPVEYCTTRAVPTVLASPYLNTLGAGLHVNIGIFWTGSKVVSEHIFKEEILELAKVLRRKPLIWDNLHANDYDTQRMFLGPYSGRSPDIIPHLMGVFTNPNCEYSLNVPALFTLAAWSHCYDQRTGNISPWNPLMAADLAIPHFLEECHRPTMVSECASFRQRPGVQIATLQSPGSTDSSVTSSNLTGAASPTTEVGQQGVPFPVRPPGVCNNGALDKDDVELLFHLFWLPHSNGPKADTLVKRFRQLRDYAHIIQKLGLYKSTLDDDDLIEGSGGPPSSDGVGPRSVDEAGNVDMEETFNTDGADGSLEAAANKAERHLVSTWLGKASHFNEVCKRFGATIDKMTFIENREMFFDINGYLSNLNVILQVRHRVRLKTA